MKKAILKILLFLAVNLLIVIVLLEFLSLRDSRLRANVSVTESVSLALGKGKHFDWLIMGSSHGRNMVRGANYFNLVHKSGKTVGSIAQTGAGVIPEFLWLKYFYDASNQADTIIYVLDPFVLYTSQWNEKLQFLSNEPFRWKLLKTIAFADLKNEVKFNYIKSKFQDKWLNERGVFIQNEEGSLAEIDTTAVSNRIQTLYPESVKEENFKKYSIVLQEIIRYAQQHHTKVIIVLPPTLLGTVPGQAEVLNLLKGLKDKGMIEYFDFSSAITDPALYYNHDHLNSRGMDLYISKWLSLVMF